MPLLGLSRSLDWLILTVFGAVCVSFALFSPFPAGFDEVAHVAYVAHILEHHDPAPALDDLRLLETDGPFRWSDERNYLNHPSLYYALMALLVAPLGTVDAAGVMVLRLANTLLSIAGLALALAIGRRAGWSTGARTAFGVALAAVPNLAAIGGMVTNDNLAWFGGALCCLGAFELLRAGPSRGRMGWMIAGFALASLAKLTAALLCGALVVVALAVVVWCHGRRVLGDPAVLLIFALGALALMPYIWLMLAHGSPAPFTAGQATLLEQRIAAIPEWRTQRLDFAAYAAHFALSLLMLWPPAIPRTDAAIMVIVVALGAAGLVRTMIAAARRALTPIERFVLCGAVAVATVMAVHVGFTFLRHLDTGWLRGIYPRYYFPLLPVLPAAVALLVGRLGRRFVPVAVVAPIGYGVAAAIEVGRIA